MSEDRKKKYFYGLLDKQIDLYVQSLGFQSRLKNVAKFCVTPAGKRFFYISSGSFGMKIGKSKRVFYPPKRYWAALREQLQLADVLLVMIGYENCQPLTVQRKNRELKPITTSLANWYDHSGLLVAERNEKMEWENWRYFDCQFYTGIKLSGHFAYESMTKSLRRKIVEVFDLPKITISINKFSQHVNIENACTAPLLYVIEALLRGKDTDPYHSTMSMPNYLNKVCKYLEGLGHDGVRGNLPWEQRPKDK